ncbi:hypothetical protein MLD38_035162 [Melastoma candidum]|uniref:Uncharacterized protein n=1 Tax=Melastoma candidum TaxID=119954 RepID=A0ACB9MCP0_9MYRT|nr:hypothetical protein MLD38_035162 [Melastoma candidum]
METTGAAPLFMILFVLTIFTEVTARLIPSHSLSLVSDGIDAVQQKNESIPLIFLPGAVSIDDASEACQQLYGFLPCSSSMLGHLFLVVVYEYLLFHGETYLASGSEQIFKLLGPGIFGASAFQVLEALPESLILLASGLLNSKETAQEYVVSGVGLLAGSSILLLTLLWGTCVILGSRDFCEETEVALPNPDSSSSRKLQWLQFFSSLKRCGVITDMETSYTARVMALSVIPFVTIQLMKLFSEPSAQDVIMLGSFSVSVVWLMLFFFYQVFQPYIQTRRLEYVKHAHLVRRILRHVQKRALGRLLTDEGTPNVEAIRRLFEEIDQDNDDAISLTELKELLVEVNFKHTHVSREEAVEEVMREFDVDGNRSISKEEFVQGFSNWLQQAKHETGEQSRRDLLQPIIQNKREERKLKQQFVFEILRRVKSKSVEGLLTESGTPDESAIRSLFERVDVNGDNSISQSELKDLVRGIQFGDASFDVDEIVVKIIEVFGKSGEGMISGEDFVTGMTGWLNMYHAGKNNKKPSQMLQSEGREDDFYQRTWQQTDKLVDEDRDERAGGDNSFWKWVRSVSLCLFGIAMLSVLAEPLIESVQNFSESANIPSFYVSFVLVPLATNAREAVSAVKETRRKKPRTTSLTFSEIYGGVIMSNIQGLTVLLALVYFRGLTWEFSAEVLVVLIICGVMGGFAGFRSTFPVWTSVLAFLAYPVSLGLVYLLDYVLNYS